MLRVVFDVSQPAQPGPSSVPPGVPEDGVDELFGLALEDFTAARDKLSRRLRTEGNRHGAGWVRSLRKPTRAAWAVNQAVRSRGDERRALLETADELGRVQTAVASGDAGADALREVSDRQQAAVQALADAARELRDARGNTLSEQVIERVTETLQAVALDASARASVESGRLTQEARAVGLGFSIAPDAAKAGAGRRRTESRQAKHLEGLREDIRRLREEAKMLRSDQREARKRRVAAQRELSLAEKEEEEVTRRLERNQARVEDLRAQVDAGRSST
jgi:hypothetical protein